MANHPEASASAVVLMPLMGSQLFLGWLSLEHVLPEIAHDVIERWKKRSIPVKTVHAAKAMLVARMATNAHLVRSVHDLTFLRRRRSAFSMSHNEKPLGVRLVR